MFVIVKFAQAWEYYFKEDPTKGISKEVIQDCSAAFTPTGKSLGIKVTYETRLECEEDTRRMNALNPSGHYSVCPVIE